MQGKMKSFFEDTGIILVLAATIYGGYYGYTIFLSDNPNVTDPRKSQEKITIVNEIPIVDTTTMQVEKIVTKVIVETTEKVESKQKEVNNKIISQKNINELLSPMEDKEIEEKKIITVFPSSIIEEIEVKKEKNVDLATLRIFLRNLKFSMASNIVKRDDINATESQELKLRVTVLKDGNFEDLLFVGGDKQLFEMNKENIQSVFPVRIDDKIKEDFPRYVRISIK